MGRRTILAIVWKENNSHAIMERKTILIVVERRTIILPVLESRTT
jgi:hypothetical protein